jgi:hypothetical protein
MLDEVNFLCNDLLSDDLHWHQKVVARPVLKIQLVSYAHAVVHKLPPSFGCGTLGVEDSNDLFILGDDIWVLEIAIRLDVSKNMKCFVDAVHFDKPAWTLW